MKISGGFNIRRNCFVALDFSKAMMHLWVILSFSLLEMPIALGGEAIRVSGDASSISPLLTKSGNPIYSEYDTNGEMVNDIGEAVDNLADLQIMAANTFSSYLELYQKTLDKYPGAQLITAEEYQNKEFVTVSGDPVRKPFISLESKYILVPADDSIFLPSINLVLMQSAINPSQVVDDSDKSLLIDSQGEIVYRSEHNIGYKKWIEIGEDSNNYLPRRRIVGAPIYYYSTFMNGKTTTDEQGEFLMEFQHPVCDEEKKKIHAVGIRVMIQLNYQTFNPRATRMSSYQIYRPSAYGCIPYQGKLGSSNVDLREHIYVGMKMLTGSAWITNYRDKALPIGEETKYDHSRQDVERIAQTRYDFDGDGAHDYVIPGKWKNQTLDSGEIIKVFQTTGTDEAEFQGIWLSSRHNDPQALYPIPDLTRLMDRAPDFEDRALLSELSKEDLKNTDLYVFRESNGQLVIERKGLDAEDDLSGLDQSESYFGYSLRIRDPFNRYGWLEDYNGVHHGNRYEAFFNGDGEIDEITDLSFEDQQIKGNLSPDFYARESDHIREGERVKIVAINRVSGYIGTVVTTVQGPQGSGFGEAVQQIHMTPPNLKIWAERKSNIEHGLTKGETRENTIGNEGAGLSDDESIVITTEWLDHDGSALPAGLADFGYTGRVARVVKANTLAEDSSGSVSQFSIRPGRQLQVIRLPQKTLAAQHVYVQVSGEPTSRKPDFSSNGVNEGILKYRPDKFVPFKVPIFDETASLLQEQAYKKAKQDQPDNTFTKPKPLYWWAYRPELQFSVYELAVEEIRREDSGLGSENILESDGPTVTSTDDFLKILYQLQSNENDALGGYSFDGDKELIFALGEQELRASVTQGAGGSQILEFDDLSVLSALEPEDYLSLRLYLNNDVGNVLWEWAFGLSPLALFSSDTLSVDEKSFDFPLFTPDNEGVNGPVVLSWEINNGGSLEKSVTTAIDGNHKNVIKLTNKSDIQHYVTVTVLRSPNESLYQEGTSSTYGPFTTKPGEPAHIQLIQKMNQLPADGQSSTEFTANVFDQFNNKVGDETDIHWFNDHTGEISQPLPTTTDGESKAVYNVGTSSGASNVYVEAGDITATASIEKQPLALSLSASATTINDVDNSPIKLSINVSGSDHLDGLEVFLQSNISELDNNVVTLVDGRGSVNFYSPGYAGEDVITASIAGVKERIKVSYLKTGSYAELNSKAIVSAVSDGSVNVETLTGPQQHSYKTSTELTIFGNPGEQYSLLAGGMYTPNSSPDLHFAMSEVGDTDGFHSNEIIDQEKNIKGTLVGNIELDRTESYQTGGTSLRFESGYINVASSDTPDISESMFANIRFLFDGDSDEASLISKGSDGDKLYELLIIKQDGQHFLEARVQTQSQLNTIRSTTPIEIDRWYIGGLAIKNGNLTLGFNSDHISTPLLGTPLDTNQNLVIGKNFVGNIDDVKVGNENASDALLTLANSTLTIGSDGKASTRVQATGKQIGFGQRVGFSIAKMNSGQALAYQELNFRSTPALELEQNIAGKGIASFFGIAMAHADSCAGRPCRGNRDSHEQGVAVVDAGLWGAVKEWATKEFIEGAILDQGKAAASFIYQLTAVHDFEVIIKSITALLDDDPLTTVDGFEATFAVISLGITIFALVTTGPGVLAVSTGLNAMKGIMKLVWNEVGPGALLNLGTIVVKRFASVMKQIATKPAAIGRSFAQIGRALGAVISGSTPGVRNIFFNIRSKNGFDNFLAIFGAAKCATVVASIEKPRSSRLFSNWQQSLTDLLISSELALIRTANAAESSCRIFPLAVFGEIANDAARFGDKATAAKVSQSLMKIALDFGPKFDGLSNEALSGLAYFGYVRHGSSGITKTEFGRMQALFIADKFPVAEVNTGFEMVNTISRMGAGFLAKTGDGGNGGHVIIKMLGSLGVIKANPTGALHTLNDMKARGYLTEGAKFEFTEPSRFFGVKRRTDLKIPKKINGIETFLRTEYKGSKSLGGRNPYNNKEFLYDVMIFLDKNESFEWVLAKGYHDLAPVAKSMIAGLNSKALEEAVAKQFTKGSDAYLDAFEKIEDMIDVLRHHPNEYLRFGAY